MELNKAQSILLAFIQKEQNKAGKRLVREREVPCDIVISSEMLQNELQSAGIIASEAEAIGTLQQLIGLGTGIKIRATKHKVNKDNTPVTLLTLRYSPPARLRMKLWREHQKRQGRSVKTFYLTPEESEKVTSLIKSLREEK